MAPAVLPLPATGSTLSVARLMGLISLRTWLWATPPLPWPGWASGLTVLVFAKTAGPTIASLCFSGSVKRVEGIEESKGTILGIFSYFKAYLAPGQVLRFLSSKPVILVLGQGVEEHKEQRGL